jgi:hypothetical protein
LPPPGCEFALTRALDDFIAYKERYVERLQHVEKNLQALEEYIDLQMEAFDKECLRSDLDAY